MKKLTERQQDLVAILIRATENMVKEQIASNILSPQRSTDCELWIESMCGDINEIWEELNGGERYRYSYVK